ncbi:SDR family oxidoreductase [Gammaproteobacteria bacterium]|nr:SDR family oxidoreductase [Gammaproteobacteria bacterium]
MQFFKLQQGIGLIGDSKVIGISGSSGGIGSTAEYSKKIVKINSRLEDAHESIAQEFVDKNVTQYIHLAAMTDTKWCNDNPEDSMLFNAEYAKKFYLAAKTAKVKRFIFVSTAHVYKPSAPSPFDTDATLDPFSIYGKSKLLAETKLLDIETLNTKLSIARVFSTIGKEARDYSLYQGLQSRAKNKDFSSIAGLDNIRDFLRTSEVMSELIRLANSSDFPNLLNICSGKGQTIRKIAEEVFASYGLKKSVDQISSLDDNSPHQIIGVPTQFK